MADDVVAEAWYPVDQALVRQYAHGLAGRLAGMTLLAAQGRDRRERAARSQLPVADLLADESGKPHIGPRIWLPCCRHATNSTRGVSKVVDQHKGTQMARSRSEPATRSLTASSQVGVPSRRSWATGGA